MEPVPVPVLGVQPAPAPVPVTIWEHYFSVYLRDQEWYSVEGAEVELWKNSVRIGQGFVTGSGVSGGTVSILYTEDHAPEATDRYNVVCLKAGYSKSLCPCVYRSSYERDGTRTTMYDATAMTEHLS